MLLLVDHLLARRMSQPPPPLSSMALSDVSVLLSGNVMVLLPLADLSVARTASWATLGLVHTAPMVGNPSTLRGAAALARPWALSGAAKFGSNGTSWRACFASSFRSISSRFGVLVHADLLWERPRFGVASWKSESFARPSATLCRFERSDNFLPLGLLVCSADVKLVRQERRDLKAKEEARCGVGSIGDCRWTDGPVAEPSEPAEGARGPMISAM